VWTSRCRLVPNAAPISWFRAEVFSGGLASKPSSLMFKLHTVNRGNPLNERQAEVSGSNCQRVERVVQIKKKPGEFLFGGRRGRDRPITTRQYARLVGQWIASIGLDPSFFGTHLLRRTKATLIYRRTGNLRAVQLLLGHKKIDYLPRRTMSRRGQLS